MEKQNNFNPGLAYADYQQLQVIYIVAALTAYFLSAYFVVGYFAGHLRIMEWDGAQWAQALPSAGLVAVMTAYQFFLYSQGDTDGGKKATWIAVAVAVAFSLLSEIGQGMERDNIRMETKSQESPTYKAAVAALGNLSSGSGIGASPYAADIANAQMKYNQCLDRLARGKEPHCEGSKGRLESYQQQEAAWGERASATSTNTATSLLGQAKAMEKDERNYHPLVNAIREALGVSGTIGSFLLSLTLIAFFEYAFHYLGGRYAKARALLMQNGYDVTRKLRQPPRKHDGSVTTYSHGNNVLPMTALDSAKMTVGEYAQKVEQGLKASPEIIATEYARAQNSREQLYQKAADKLDSIQADLNKASEPKDWKYINPTMEEREARSITSQSNREQPEIVETDGFKQSPAQLAKVQELYNQQLRDNANGKTYRQELAEGQAIYSDSPLDKPRSALPKMSVEATVQQIQSDVRASGANTPEAIRASVFNSFATLQNPAPLDDAILQRIADRLVIKQAHAPAPARPANQKPGATGLQNPALGSDEEHYPLPIHAVPGQPEQPVTTVRAQSEQRDSNAQSGQPEQPVTTVRAQSEQPEQTELTGAAKQAEIDLYPEWASQVSGQVITPSARDAKRFISQATFSKGDKTSLTVQEMGRIWLSWQERGATDGILKPNPKYQPGNRQAKYLLAA